MQCVNHFIQVNSHSLPDAAMPGLSETCNDSHYSKPIKMQQH